MDPDAAFRRVYDENASSVRAFLFHKCGTQNLDDLVQQTFIKVWKSLSKFENRSLQKTWIFKIALNVTYDFHRKKDFISNSSPEMLQENQPSEQSNPDEKILVEQALCSLDPKQKDLCLLYYFQGFALKEISDILELPEGTVKSRLFELRMTLKDLLKENS